VSNLTHRLPVACTLLFAAAIAVPAHAAPAPPFLSYAAKFVCGPQKTDADVVRGMYATDINIHNPQAKTTVRFFKKAVIPGTKPADIKYFGDSLTPDGVEQVQCADILKLLGGQITADQHIEGFVVLEVPPIATATAPAPVELDVVGKYTARPFDSDVQSLGIVRVPPTEPCQRHPHAAGCK